MPLKYQAVLIDLDGTLVDTLSEIADAANAMLADAGKPPVDSRTVSFTVGEGAAVLVERLLGRDAIERWLPIYLDHYRSINGTTATLYPNVVKGLEAMRAAGLAVACVTNKPAELVGPLLDHLGVTALFDTVIGGGDTPHKKPHPGPLLAACARLKVDPTACVMIGDSINDALAADAAGATSLTVPYGYPGSAGDEGRAEGLLDRGLTHAIVRDLFAAAEWIVMANDPLLATDDR